MARPGVYVQEAPLPRLIEGASATTTYGAFIGTALQGSTEVQLVTSWSIYQNLYGGLSSGTNSATMTMAAYQFFLNGGSGAYFKRVLSSDAVASDVTIPSVDDGNVAVLAFAAISPGIWGNGLALDVNITAGQGADPDTFDVVVRNTIRGVSVIQERFQELTLDPDTPRYVEKIINSTTIGSVLVRVDDVNNGQLPDVVPENQSQLYLSGGSNGVAVITGGTYAAAVDDFEGIEGNLLFNAPGITAVDAMVSKVEARGDSFVVVDPPSDLAPADVETVNFPVSSYAGVWYPWLGITDPASDAPRGALRFVPPGGSVVGMIMRIDTQRGSYKAPAGISAGLSGAVTTQRKLTNANLDSLNDLNINAIRPVAGAGIVAMGARTRDFTTSARYVSVRRTLNYIKSQARASSAFALFEPNTPVLWEQLRVANGSWLSELWGLGGLAGASFEDAFYVKVDGENNTPQTIVNGEVHIEIGVAPVYPAEFVIITVGEFQSTASVVVTEES